LREEFMGEGRGSPELFLGGNQVVKKTGGCRGRRDLKGGGEKQEVGRS